MLGVTFPVTTGVTAEIAMTMKWEREILDPVPGGTVANLSDYRSPLVDPAFFVTESTPTGFKVCIDLFPPPPPPPRALSADLHFLYYLRRKSAERV